MFTFYGSNAMLIAVSLKESQNHYIKPANSWLDNCPVPATLRFNPLLFSGFVIINFWRIIKSDSIFVYHFVSFFKEALNGLLHQGILLR